MKKLLTVMVIASIVLTGCSTTTTKIGLTDLQEQDTDTMIAPGVATGQIDFDLTTLDTTDEMIQDIAYNPDKYIGKKIRLQGISNQFTDPDTLITYYSVRVRDNGNGGMTYIEYLIGDDELGSYQSYKNTYPEDESEIIITGIYETYEENDHTFYRLKNSEVSVLDKE